MSDVMFLMKQHSNNSRLLPWPLNLRQGWKWPHSNLSMATLKKDKQISFPFQLKKLFCWAFKCYPLGVPNWSWLNRAAHLLPQNFYNIGPAVTLCLLQSNDFFPSRDLFAETKESLTPRACTITHFTVVTVAVL